MRFSPSPKEVPSKEKYAFILAKKTAKHIFKTFFLEQNVVVNAPHVVTSGWGTKNEMLNLIFQYLNYTEGDENK